MDTFRDLKLYQLPVAFALEESEELRARASLNLEISAKLEQRIRANVGRFRSFN